MVQGAAVARWRQLLPRSGGTEESHLHRRFISRPQQVARARTNRRIQTRLHLAASTDRNGPWGDDMGHKGQNTLRVGFQNVSGLPFFAGNIKNQHICHFLNDGAFDVFGIAETNIYWRKLAIRDQLEERFFGWWEDLRLSRAYNTKDRDSPILQHGGTLLMALNQTAHRVCSHEEDLAEMGTVGQPTLPRQERYFRTHSVRVPAL